jgi:hypothetical protein
MSAGLDTTGSIFAASGRPSYACRLWAWRFS